MGQFLCQLTMCLNKKTKDKEIRQSSKNNDVALNPNVYSTSVRKLKEYNQRSLRNKCLFC